MTLNVQLVTMLVMIASGMYLGMAQDTYRRLSIHWKGQTLIKYVMEASFWLTQTLLLFYVLFLVNNGALRLYIFLACLLGYSTYRALVASLYQSVLETIIRIIKRVYTIFRRIVEVLIIAPLQWLFRLIVAMVLVIVNVLFSILLFLFKIIYWPIAGLFRIVYHLLPQSVQRILHKIAGFYSTMEKIVIKWTKHILRKWRS
ncbi:spore cortex biosynthesis protein YabQ [Lentibacillus saliphilus]|uniref:spore cortex biosynthesis protein YabQ n=1 Tax=Lentibacillus saliphilus TaxID=2737028 RepID=UPI001C311428|nr:spore cortex biosynthesis protein YabQ [Lentibacillus saliphilus]